MSVLTLLSESIKEGRKDWETRDENKENCNFEKIFQSRKKECKNILASGDSRDFMTYLKLKGYSGKFKAVYIDPPFFSKAKYNTSFAIEDETGDSCKIKMEAYDDRWNNSIETYIEYITSMMCGIHELLSDEGVVILHIDWHASHYCRIVMDEIFGSRNFINEIIWTYKSGGAGKKSFARKHDNILIYGKSRNYTFNPSKVKSYNRNFRKYSFKGVEEFQDEKGWYTMVNERDVWSMDMVGRTSSERTGYATQKPRALICKLINAFTNENDLVGDFCAGSGTVAKVCEELNRRWICADINNGAVSMIMSYLGKENSEFSLLARNSHDLTKRENHVLSFGNGAVQADFRGEGYRRLKEKLSSDSSAAVEKIGCRCPEAFINFMSFDFDYDGIVHKSDIMYGKMTGNSFKEDIPGEKVHIAAWDVFGNFYEEERGNG